MQGPMEPRIINGVEIVFGTRSECDVPSWECPHCHEMMKTIRFLVFDFPPLYCVGCKSMNPSNFSLNLATVLINEISIVGEVKEQEIKEGDPGECVAYAVAQLTEMMNRIMIACSSEEPVLSAANTYCVPDHFINRFAEEFPDRTTGGGVHKILRMLSMLLAGVPMESKSTQSVDHHFTGGEIRAIHCDDFEEVCRQIADGNAVLATFFDGIGYGQLQYCQYYTAMPASVVAQLIADGEKVSAHVVVLVGVISEQGHRAYFALDSAGTAFCRQVGSAEGWRSLFNWNKKRQLGGYGKITANSAWYTNFFKVSRQNDHGLPPKLFVANLDPDDYLFDDTPTDLTIAPQEEGDIILDARNRLYIFHGRYLRCRFRQFRY